MRQGTGDLRGRVGVAQVAVFDGHGQDVRAVGGGGGAAVTRFNTLIPDPSHYSRRPDADVLRGNTTTSAAD